MLIIGRNEASKLLNNFNACKSQKFPGKKHFHLNLKQFVEKGQVTYSEQQNQNWSSITVNSPTGLMHVSYGLWWHWFMKTYKLQL